MNVPRYAALAAKLLGSRVARGAPPAGDRGRGLETIAGALQARTRRKRLGFVGLVLAAAAALVLWRAARPSQRISPVSSVALSASPLGRGAALVVDNREFQLSAQASIAPGQAIDTPTDGGASLQLATGTELSLGSASSVRVDSAGPTERFSLARGRLTVHVVKLTNGRRFIVATPDAEIEVRGTRFELNVLSQAEGCGNGSRTRLSVGEGVVEVRSAGVNARVSAGQMWPADCVASEPVSAQAPPAAAPAVSAAAPVAAVPSAPAMVASRAAAEPSSGLSRQNDLFAEAVSLRRRGDAAGALRTYQELIARFPTSPLAQNAMVERMRLLAALQSERAREEGRRYLSRYPKGFAVEEARRLVDAP
jgi:ferric-dicitrate binding protein FerR (iron transport regulator)